MAKFKVLYTAQLSHYATDIFEANDFEVRIAPASDEETLCREVAAFQPDAIMCRVAKVTAKVMSASQKLKVVGKQGAGIDNIDMDYTEAHNIPVVYLPSGNANAVAEHALLLMLACAKRFNYVENKFRTGDFMVRMTLENTYELEGKTLGVIGCGRISSLLMQKAKYGFNMKTIGYDPFVTQEKIGDLCEMKANAEDVWREADFVSVHLPALPSTNGTIGREQFALMKPTASFINCARGSLVREDEMLECLKDGTLFQAGLDVFVHEPPVGTSLELQSMHNVIITPHMAGTTEQSVERCCTSVANDIVAVCNGKEPKCAAKKIKY